MSSDLHNISYQIGEIRGHLEAINKNTSEIKADVRDVSDRVLLIEKSNQFKRGAESQNKKIAGIVGGVFGFVGGAIMPFFQKILQ